MHLFSYNDSIFIFIVDSVFNMAAISSMITLCQFPGKVEGHNTISFVTIGTPKFFAFENAIDLSDYIFEAIHCRPDGRD